VDYGGRVQQDTRFPQSPPPTLRALGPNHNPSRPNLCRFLGRLALVSGSFNIMLFQHDAGELLLDGDGQEGPGMIAETAWPFLQVISGGLSKFCAALALSFARSALGRAAQQATHELPHSVACHAASRRAHAASRRGSLSVWPQP